jgi:SAM-dependent methyltransferase
MNHLKAHFFDGYAEAPWAAAGYTPAELEKIAWLFSEMGAGPGQGVLEPGCGTGRLTQLLAERVGGRGRVLACDISAAMIKLARRRCRCLPWVELHQAALEELTLAPASFDAVVCFNVFPHLDRKPEALALIAATLKPGGHLAIFHLEPSSVINDLHRKAGTVIERDLLPDQATLTAMLQAAGLTPLSFRDDDRFLAMAGKAG